MLRGVARRAGRALAVAVPALVLCTAVLSTGVLSTAVLSTAVLSTAVPPLAVAAAPAPGMGGAAPPAGEVLGRAVPDPVTPLPTLPPVLVPVPPPGPVAPVPTRVPVRPLPPAAEPGEVAPRTPPPSPSPTPGPSPAPTRPGGPVVTRPPLGGDELRVDAASLVGRTVEESREALVEAGLPREITDGLPDDARILEQRDAPGSQTVMFALEAAPEEVAPGGGPPAPGDPPVLPPPSGTDDPPPGGLPSTALSLRDSYVEQCRRLDRDFEPGWLLVDERLEMQLDAPSRVAAAVTLDEPLAPRRIVGLEDARAVELLVTCQVRARLVGPPGATTVDPTAWQTQSLLTDRTGQFAWFVVPQRAGDLVLEVVVQPVVVQVDQQDPGASGVLEATTARYPVAVNVSEPTLGVVQRALDAAGALLSSARGALVALTGLVVAALGLWALLRRRGTTPPGGAAAG